MAKTGKKTFIYEIQFLDDLTEIIEYAKKRAKISGIRAHIEYKHDLGLSVSVAGPRDKINLFDHLLREFVNSLEEDYF